MTQDPSSKFTSRKWRLTIGVILIAMLARGLNWIDGAQFVSLLTWSVGLYMAGNVGQAISDKITIKSELQNEKPQA